MLECYQKARWRGNGATVRSMSQNILGNRLRQMREEAGWTLEYVSDQLRGLGVDVGGGQLGHIERGVRQPSIEVMRGLAHLLDTSADYLLGLTDNAMSAEDMETELRRGGLGGRLGDVFQSLSLPRREAVMLVAQGLAALEQTERHAEGIPVEVYALANVLIEQVGMARADRMLDDLASKHPHLAQWVRAVIAARGLDQSAQFG